MGEVSSGQICARAFYSFLEIRWMKAGASLYNKSKSKAVSSGTDPKGGAEWIGKNNN
ncbi:hypothetical protein ABR330_07655 [Bacillus cabrialesii subsp. cabrialesii]